MISFLPSFIIVQSRTRYRIHSLMHRIDTGKEGRSDGEPMARSIVVQRMVGENRQTLENIPYLRAP